MLGDISVHSFGRKKKSTFSLSAGGAMAAPGGAEPGWGPGRFALNRDHGSHLRSTSPPRSAFGMPAGASPAADSDMRAAAGRLAGQVAMEGGRQIAARASLIGADVRLKMKNAVWLERKKERKTQLTRQPVQR